MPEPPDKQGAPWGSPDQREASGRRYCRNRIPDKNSVEFRKTNTRTPACSQDLERSLVRPGFVVKCVIAILGTGEGTQKPPAVLMVKIMKVPVTCVQRNSLALCCEEASCGLNLVAMLFAHLVCALLRVFCGYVQGESVDLLGGIHPRVPTGLDEPAEEGPQTKLGREGFRNHPPWLLGHPQVCSSLSAGLPMSLPGYTRTPTGSVPVQFGELRLHQWDTQAGRRRSSANSAEHKKDEL